MNIDYSHRPPQINTINDLITFFSGIPEDAWFIGSCTGPDGSRCAVGHIGRCYASDVVRGKSPYRILPCEGKNLARANDGRFGFSALGSTPKARVLAYLRSLEPTSAPSSTIMNQVTTLASTTTP